MGGGMGTVRRFADVESFRLEAARDVAARVERAVAARGRCDLALAGGTTPKSVYERLATLPLRWRAVHVWFGDERCVVPTDPESNFAMARAALLDRVDVPAANVHRMSGELADADAAARAYERELPASLDLLLLGLGPDGHTASLFPGSSALAESQRRVVAVVGPKPPPRRLTIAPSVVAAAREVVVLATGAEKAAAVARALREEGSIAECPARLARRGTWLLDAAAASELEARPAESRRNS